jgi:hypothetical protein
MSVSTTRLSDLDPVQTQQPLSNQHQQQMQQQQQQQQMQQQQSYGSSQQQQPPQYVLYVLPNSKGCNQAIKQYQILHKFIRLINVADLPKEKVPLWLDGVPTLIDLASRKMFKGSLAIQHLFHLTQSSLAQQEKASFYAGPNDGKQGPSRAPLPGNQPVRSGPSGSVSRSDRMETPLGPPPATFAPNPMQGDSKTNPMGMQPSLKESMEQPGFDPMPPPSVSSTGAGHQPISNQQKPERDPDIAPKKAPSLLAGFDGPERPPEIDLTKYNMGGKTKIATADLENYKAMRERQTPSNGKVPQK